MTTYVTAVLGAAAIAFPGFGEQVSAERAVGEWVNGRAPQGRINQAHDALMVAVARAEHRDRAP